VDVALAGTTVVVRGGTYAGFAVTRRSLIITAAPGEQVVVSGGSYVILVRGTSDVTIRGLTVRDAPDLWGSGVRVETSTRVRVEGNRLLQNHSFGIKVKDATSVAIVDNDISENDTGIELSGAVDGALVDGNRIHDNDRMVTNSRGGNAIVFTITTGAILVKGNRIWGNRAPHLTDSGYDGGAFEVYGASDVRIEDNVMWDNNNVMETGTDGIAACARLTFVRNVAYGAGSVPGETTGLILRCASDSLFAHNTFDGLDDYAFYVAAGGSYAGSIARLRIEDNVVYRGRAYSLTGGLPSDLVIDHDLVRPGGSTATYATHVAYVAGHGNTDSLAEFRAWTGLDQHGLQAEPRFVDADGRDYHLTSLSAAVDAGIDVLGAPYVGAAPDIGRYEFGQ
jgi:parallel beta-helix repeat protein